MLQIILMLLKIIGTIILVLLGILLLLLTTVLVVPVRYRLSVKLNDTLYLNGTVSWLLHILHTKISIVESRPHVIIRIAGFVIYDSEKPKRPRKRRYNNKKKTTEKKSNIKEGETSKSLRASKVTQIDNKTIINNENNNLNINNTEGDDKEPSIVHTDNKGINNVKKNKEKQKRETLLERVINKIRNLLKRITDLFRNLRIRINSFFQSFLNRKRQSGLIIDFLRDELNKDGFRFIFGSIKKLLKHILPRKLKASILYGTGDPCSTGQILGGLGILYSFYGDKLQITPDFENRRLEGSLDARGRIRLITILIIVIKLILDRRFKQLKNNLITLKEAL
ncbi:MAG: DUF2953 domain-containing protein [Clostridiales bacterium]|nr:DUF2953 domain-containing protein [Clostridiales bacterium]